MQEFNFYQKPCPYLVIDNFLPSQLARACLKEAIDLEPHYEDAGIAEFDELPDDCEECKKERIFLHKARRDNKVVYLDYYFEKNRTKSMILKSIQLELLNSKEIKDVIKELPNLFPILDNITSTESILSSYGKCDFYGWHTDRLKNKAQRIITLVYYMNTEPQKFKGGQLVLTGDTITAKKTIEPRHNRAVLFESKRIHSVTDVDLIGDFKDHRFSVNMWFGFDGVFKL